MKKFSKITRLFLILDRFQAKKKILNCKFLFSLSLLNQKEKFLTDKDLEIKFLLRCLLVAS